MAPQIDHPRLAAALVDPGHCRLMAANNEIGTIHDVPGICGLVHEARGVVPATRRSIRHRLQFIDSYGFRTLFLQDVWPASRSAARDDARRVRSWTWAGRSEAVAVGTPNVWDWDLARRRVVREHLDADITRMARSVICSRKEFVRQLADVDQRRLWPVGVQYQQIPKARRADDDPICTTSRSQRGQPAPAATWSCYTQSYC